MSFYTTLSSGQPWDWPGADAVSSGGGVKGKFQGLNSFIVWAGGTGSKSDRERPERPKRGNIIQSELQRRTVDTKSRRLMVLSPGLLHRGQDCCSECRWDAGGQKEKGKDIWSLFIKSQSQDFHSQITVRHHLGLMSPAALWGAGKPDRTLFNLFVFSFSLQSQYTQGDFPTTLPQVRSYTVTQTFSLSQIWIVFDSDHEFQKANSLVLLPGYSICMSDVLLRAESPPVNSSINGRLLWEED